MSDIVTFETRGRIVLITLNRPESTPGDLTPTEFDLRWNQTNQPQAAERLNY